MFKKGWQKSVAGRELRRSREFLMTSSCLTTECWVDTIGRWTILFSMKNTKRQQSDILFSFFYQFCKEFASLLTTSDIIEVAPWRHQTFITSSWAEKNLQRALKECRDERLRQTTCCVWCDKSSCHFTHMLPYISKCHACAHKFKFHRHTIIFIHFKYIQAAMFDFLLSDSRAWWIVIHFRFSIGSRESARQSISEFNMSGWKCLHKTTSVVVKEEKKFLNGKLWKWRMNFSTFFTYKSSDNNGGADGDGREREEAHEKML